MQLHNPGVGVILDAGGMSMRVPGIVGSSRRQGNTFHLVWRVLEPLAAAGVDTQIIFLDDADALVLASPTYWYTVSSDMKRFIDRSYSLIQYPEDRQQIGRAHV